MNSSLSNGIVPPCLKQAVVSSQIKKTGFDCTDLNNFLNFEITIFFLNLKVVLFQITPFLLENDILDKFQSGFRAGHSTETALVKVLNDLLIAVDFGLAVVLISLDLSAAFNTFGHLILLDQLECEVGIRGTALKWFHSYLH